MSGFFPRWQRLRNDEAGAVTVDWVALTAAAILLGTATVYAIFGKGVGPLTDNISQVTISASEIEFEPVPNLNNG